MFKGWEVYAAGWGLQTLCQKDKRLETTDRMYDVVCPTLWDTAESRFTEYWYFYSALFSTETLVSVVYRT